MAYDAKFRVWRGDAADGDLQDYTVEVNEGEVVLDVIHRLQATQTPDLAVRWNCKAGKCGSCSAEVNGRPRLMCMTRMSTFTPDETVTVTPLRAFPVMRDLVTDVSFNYEKARTVPSFAGPPGPGARRVPDAAGRRGAQPGVPQVHRVLPVPEHLPRRARPRGEQEASFAGPRFLIRLAELDMHPLDTVDRKDDAQDEHGLGLCNITKCCTEVCPEHIKITDNGIIPLKERVADRRFDPLRRKTRRRDA